jgi:hypothetical protein
MKAFAWKLLRESRCWLRSGGSGGAGSFAPERACPSHINLAGRLKSRRCGAGRLASEDVLGDKMLASWLARSLALVQIRCLCLGDLARGPAAECAVRQSDLPRPTSELAAPTNWSRGRVAAAAGTWPSYERLPDVPLAACLPAGRPAARSVA